MSVGKKKKKSVISAFDTRRTLLLECAFKEDVVPCLGDSNNADPGALVKGGVGILYE